jgi:hypothetical protein
MRFEIFQTVWHDIAVTTLYESLKRHVHIIYLFVADKGLLKFQRASGGLSHSVKSGEILLVLYEHEFVKCCVQYLVRPHSIQHIQ